MRKPLNQLVWVGLASQAMVWDPVITPLVYSVLWFLATRLPPRFAKPNPFLEGTLLILGSIIGWFGGKLFGNGSQFFLSHGLAAVALARLSRPLNPAERRTTFLIALFHLAVACTVILDPRFALVFLAALITIPRALAQLAAEDLLEAASPRAPRRTTPKVTVPLRLGWRLLVLLAAVSALFFAAFPRGLLGAGWRGGTFRTTGPSMLDTVLDPARGGSANSRSIVLQIQGDQLGYLRAYVLGHFDGTTWSVGDHKTLVTVRPPPTTNQPTRVRAVTVRNPAILGRNLPTDGHVASVTGNFFRRTFRTESDLIEVESPYPRAGARYTYSTVPPPTDNTLPASLSQSLTRVPTPSIALRAWLDQTLKDTTNSLQRARTLEHHLRTRFAYELGAPELNRLNALEDFILNQRRGHCERFASALALLLRMEGIPARVVIGYAPSGRNWLNGAWNIRMRDAHAWTEAWFPEVGWVELDATPRSTVPSGSGAADLLDAADGAWYSYVVNLDGTTQMEWMSRGFGLVTNAFRHSAILLSRHITPALLGLGVLGAFIMLHRRARRTPAPSQPPLAGSPEVAAGLYADFLTALAHQGFPRATHFTPLEYLRFLEARGYPSLDAARELTTLFLEVRYAGRPLDPSQWKRMEALVLALQPEPNPPTRPNA